MDASYFRELVSGRRGGFGAGLVRSMLRLAEIPYRCVVRYRNDRYDRGQFAVHSVPVPVISVGNLTLGGTGKTPLVAWLADWFQRRNVRVTIISRGYGGRPGSPNDEARELQQRLPGIPHIQNPDRLSAAKTAVSKYRSEIIILDDAFQHRRIERDLDIVLLDALEPFGYEHVFPRGMLREPLCGLARADMVALSRADAIGLDDRAAIRRYVGALAPDSFWTELTHAPRELVSATGNTVNFEQLVHSNVAAFCGIGNPEGFRHTLLAAGLRVTAWRTFPDHHNYSQRDLRDLESWVAQIDTVQAVLCTQKDLVKLEQVEIAKRPLYALQIDLHFESGQPELEERLVELLHR